MTALGIKVTRRAAREITKACEWWDANRPAAPGVLRSEIEPTFGLLALQPGIGARALNAKLTGVPSTSVECGITSTIALVSITARSRFSPCGIPVVEPVRACDEAAAEQAVGADPLNWTASRDASGAGGSRRPLGATSVRWSYLP